jgi:hypothetical protein
MFKNGNRFKILFAIGTAILIAGLIVNWYPTSIINGMKERLKQTDVSTDERDKLEGALASWDIWQITLFQPLSSLLLAVGIITMVYSVIYGIFSIVSSYKVVKKEEK